MKIMKTPSELAAEEEQRKESAFEEKMKIIVSDLEKITTAEIQYGRITSAGGLIKYKILLPEYKKAVSEYFANHGWNCEFQRQDQYDDKLVLTPKPDDVIRSEDRSDW